MDVVEKKEIVHEVDQYEHNPYCNGYYRRGYGYGWGDYDGYRHNNTRGLAGTSLCL